MSDRRGHVPNWNLARYRMLRRAKDGAINAAIELAQLGEQGMADEARAHAERLHEAMTDLRVLLGDEADR